MASSILSGGGKLDLGSLQRAQDLAEDDEKYGAALGNPTEGLSIPNHRERMRAWRKLARRRHGEEPAAFSKGKERWNALVTYDSWRDKVLWNGTPLPGSRCWKSNALPGEHMGKVVLVLMFKNEAPILERMLASVVDSIDAFCVIDTGSTDRSRELTWEFLVDKHHKRGHLYEIPFYDFGTNRTLAVQLAHGAGDYGILMDADYVLAYRDDKGESVPSFDWRAKLPPLNAGAPMMYLLGTTGDLSYARPHIVRLDVMLKYVNRTHEFLAVSEHDKSGVPMRQEPFPYVMIDHRGDGCTKADKLPRDVVLCLMDSYDDPTRERPYFYLANTLRQLRMPYDSRTAHKRHMSLCAWSEELTCSAKGALETMWATKETDPRQLAMVLHASFQNPERLEILAQYLRKLRSTPSLWPAWAHVGATIGSLFTHNVYPAHQKLFLETWELKFGVFSEISVACFYCPQYFELGLHLSKRLLEDPEFDKQSKPVQDMTRRNRELFEGRQREWIARGMRMTPAIRKHLLERAHKFYAQARFARARDLYAIALHPIVMRDAVTDESLLPKNAAEETKAVAAEAELLNTKTYHRMHRLSAWQNGKPLHHAVTEADQDRALCCYQMGRCDERLQPGNAGKLLVAVHYVDSLKFCPMYAPATSALYELTLLAPPDVTRCILYLLRAVTAGPALLSAAMALRPVKAVVEAMASDQSVWCRVAPLPRISSTNVVSLPLVPPRIAPAIEIKSQSPRPVWIAPSLLRPLRDFSPCK